MKNCFTCALAKDQGLDFFCKFDPEKLALPMWPLFYAKMTKTACRKEKVPNRDCGAWKAKRAKAPEEQPA